MLVGTETFAMSRTMSIDKHTFTIVYWIICFVALLLGIIDMIRRK